MTEISSGTIGVITGDRPKDGPEFLSSDYEPQPEVTSTQEVFAGHVAEIRQHGDALDAVRRFHSFRGGLGGKIATAALVGETLSHIGDAPFPSLFTAASIGVGKVAYDVAARDRALKQATQRLNPEIGTALQENYELYRVRDAGTGQPEIVMRWYGSMGHDETLDNVDNAQRDNKLRSPAESMELIAELAEANDIKAVLVGPEVLSEDILAADRFSLAELPLKGWLRKNKRITARFQDNGQEDSPKVFAYTPDRLRALAREWTQQTYDLPALESVVSVLRATNADHPIVRNFDDYKGSKEVAQKVERTAKLCLERQLDDVAAIRTVDDQGVAIRHKSYIQGTVRQDKVRWLETGKRFGQEHDTAGLLQAFGLTEAKIEDMLQNPDIYPRPTVVRAAECAAYLAAHMPPKLKDEIERQPLTSQEHLLQDRLIASIGNWERQPLLLDESNQALTVDTLFRKRIRFWGSALLAGATVVASLTANAELQEYENDLYIASEQEYANQLGIDRMSLNDTQIEQVHSEALEGRPLLSLYVNTHDAIGAPLEAADRFLDNLRDGQFSFGDGSGIADNNGANSVGGGYSLVGNSPQGESDREPVWNLDAAGGLGTGGYWAAETGSSYQQEYSVWHNTADYSEQPEELPTKPGSDVTRYIMVSRDMIEADFHPYDDSTALPNAKVSVSSFVYIPVLDGMKPVAANYGGETVELLQSDAGTYGIGLGQHYDEIKVEQPQLTYWLVPDTDSTARATAPTELNITRKETRGISQQWNAVLPDGSLEGESRARQASDYIYDNFSYSYEPLDKITNRQVRGLLDGTPEADEFVAGVLKNKQANCNVAATIVALDNNEVTPAWGFANDGDDALTGAESHMWLVTKDGEEIDPTPPEDQNMINIFDDTPSKLDSLQTLLLGGLLGAVGAGEWLRRKTERPRAARRLNRYSVEELIDAKHAADTAAYAFPGSRIQTRPVTDIETSHEAALESLGQHQVHSAHVCESLERAIDVAQTRHDRKLFKNAQKVIRIMRRAGLHKQAVDRNDIRGILGVQ